jgi:hypothetical protein
MTVTTRAQLRNKQAEEAQRTLDVVRLNASFVQPIFVVLLCILALLLVQCVLFIAWNTRSLMLVA